MRRRVIMQVMTRTPQPLRAMGIVMAIIEQLVTERTTELSQTNAALEHEIARRQQAESRLFSMTQSAVDGIISADSQGRILTWNNGACAIFGYTADEIIGQPLTTLMPGRYRAAHQQGLERIRATGESALMGKALELSGLRKDGQEFPVELTLSTWTSTEGRSYSGIIRDITERKQVERHFQGLIESAPDAMVIVNQKGEMVLVNGQTEQLFGYQREELPGHPVEMLLPEQYHGKHVEDRTGYFAAPRARPMGAGLTLYGRRKDGREFPVEISRSPLQTTAGLLVSGAIRDVTERIRAEQVLKQARRELTRSNADLEQFAYAASHDLQEPLRAVAGCVQLLEFYYRDHLDTRANELMAHAVAGVSRMQALIHNLLAYARLSTRGEPFEPTECEQMVKDVQVNLAVALKESGAVVTAEALPTVMADPAQLQQVFHNLISNAVKFRGEQPPEIHISAQRHDGAWVLAVRDNGIGIEPQYFERIFQMFQRLHTQQEHPGTGIGLAMCKRIVERHGGRIWVTSQPGEGSTFFFSISDQR